MFNSLYRSIKKYLFKLLRSDGSPHHLAMAVALGFFVGCFIPPGGHTIIVLLLAFLFRTDRIIAFAATWIANPYTVPFLYPLFCFVGTHILGANIPEHHINQELSFVIHNFSWHNLMKLSEDFAISFLIGGFIFGIIFALIGYLLTYWTVKAHRTKKEKKKQKAIIS